MGCHSLELLHYLFENIVPSIAMQPARVGVPLISYRYEMVFSVLDGMLFHHHTISMNCCSIRMLCISTRSGDMSAWDRVILQCYAMSKNSHVWSLVPWQYYLWEMLVDLCAMCMWSSSIDVLSVCHFMWFLCYYNSTLFRTRVITLLGIKKRMFFAFLIRLYWMHFFIGMSNSPEVSYNYGVCCWWWAFWKYLQCWQIWRKWGEHGLSLRFLLVPILLPLW